MNPDETTDSQSGGAEPPSTQPSIPLQPHTAGSQRDAATNIIRSNIDQLYGGNVIAEVEPTPQAAVSDSNPYDRTHSDTPLPQAEQWKAYHSAWQTYYQKYYEGYYTHHIDETKKQLSQHVEHSNERHYFGSQPIPEPTEEDEPMTKDEALFDLRQKLLGRVQASARKVRKSRHFVPIVAAIFVILVFTFIQYNTLITGTVAAYVSPGSIDPQNIVVDPNTDIHVSQDPRLIIPKINVDVPVLYDVGSDYDSQMAAMAKGVAQFAIPGASAHPGEVGNTAIAGHSSNDLFDTGDYKFIFAQLEKLAPGDTIYANYKGIRYTYVVTKSQVVSPDDVSALVYPVTKPVLTLITCTPVGTSKNRLLVTAEQVSPDPTTAVAATNTNVSGSSTLSGGTAPTLFEKLFGAGG